METELRVAFVIFDGMTALDFVGVFDPVTRLKTMGIMPGLEYDVCATTREVTDGSSRNPASSSCKMRLGYGPVKL